MRHGSLFSGIGGFDLAAEWMGWDNVFHCEWNPFGQRNLKYHFPNAESFNDITKTDFTKYANKIDILTGGFPCQPYSSAGKRKGKEDERHLWPEMLRAIREISPRFVVGENVRGLTNWNGGMVFDEVCAELETLGYQVAPCIIPACGVDAPHRRERVWFVAYADGNARRCGPRESGCQERKANSNGESAIYFRIDTTSKTRNTTYAHSNKLNERNRHDEINAGQGGFNAQCDVESLTLHANSPIGQGEHIRQTWQREFDEPDCGNGINNFKNFPTQSPICGRDDGLPAELDGITFSKWREESIKAYGNAIVPQVAYQIFKAIQETGGI
jgi:DNA (cytosine-5)-methyltransferase 1